MKKLDIAIVGGGVAGLSALLWALRLNLSAKVFEASPRIGGQLQWIHNPLVDFLGASYSSGEELLHSIEKQIQEHSSLIQTHCSIVDFSSQEGWVRDATGSTHACKHIVLATGLVRKRLEFLTPWENQLVFYTASQQKERFQGKDLLIIGGGDGAFENALLLEPFCKTIRLFVRGKTSHAQSYFQKKVAQKSNIHVLYETECTKVEECLGKSIVTARSLGSFQKFTVDFLLVKIGFVPVFPISSTLLQTHSKGHAKTNSSYQSSLSNVWCIGDVQNEVNPSISSAIGDASRCIHNIAKELEPQK